MTSILETQVTQFLTQQLGRVPTQDEIQNGVIAPWTLAQIQNSLNVGQSILTLNPGDDIQSALESLALNGGGTLNLAPGTFSLSETITIPSQINFIGSGSGLTELDFGGTSANLIATGTLITTTGTVDVVNKSTTVTGIGTTWTTDMIGSSFLAGDYWYEITDVSSTTSLEIDSPYFSSTASGISYVIANTIGSLTLQGFTLLNSTSSLLDLNYVDGINVQDVVAVEGNKGFDFDFVGSAYFFTCSAFSCGTGLDFNVCPFPTMVNSAFVGNSGDGVVLSTVTNSAITAVSVESNGGNGFTLSNCSNMGIVNTSVQNNANIGVEFVTGNDGVDFEDGTVADNGSDGVRFTSSNNANVITANSFTGNAGYGINIADVSNENCLITSSTFDTNTSGAIQNSGTSTLIRSNVGATDN